jgi:hypothetical protein
MGPGAGAAATLHGGLGRSTMIGEHLKLIGDRIEALLDRHGITRVEIMTRANGELYRGGPIRVVDFHGTYIGPRAVLATLELLEERMLK